MSLDTIPASLFLDFIPFSIIGMVSEDKSKSRAKKKRVVKKISRDEEDEDEIKPLEEKVEKVCNSESLVKNDLFNSKILPLTCSFDSPSKF